MGITFSFEVVLLGDCYPETQTINFKYLTNIHKIVQCYTLFTLRRNLKPDLVVGRQVHS